MSSAPNKAILPVAWRRFVEVCQRLRYGRIARLAVRGGLPLLDSNLRGTRTVKVQGRDQGAHPLAGRGDTQLPREFLAFIDQMMALGDGEVRNLEITNGLPFSYEIDETLGG